MSYVQSRMAEENAGQLLYQLGINGTDAQRLSEERLSIVTSLRDIVGRMVMTSLRILIKLY